MGVVVHAATILVTAMVGMGVAVVGGASVTAQQLAGAADAAALAAADVAAGFVGGDPCVRAEEVAHTYGASVTQCAATAHSSEITVATTYAGFAVTARARAGPPASNAPTHGGDGWVRPSDGSVTSGFGPREQQCTSGFCSTSDHEGVDYAAGCGAPVYAARSGTVVMAGDNGGFGTYLRIDHGDAVTSAYAHLQVDAVFVSVGDPVFSGQLLALEGDTGHSFGCHVHIEIHVGGEPVDPQLFLP